MKALLSAEVARSTPSFRDCISRFNREARLRGRTGSRLRQLGSLTSYSDLEEILPANLNGKEVRQRLPRYGEFVVQLGNSGGRSMAPTDFLTVSGVELAEYRSMLGLMLRRIGLRAGSRLAIMDYSTSIPALSASQFCNGLGVDGISEELGLSTICCDGLPELVPRSVYVIQKVRPNCVLVRSDLFQLLRTALKARLQGKRVPSPLLLITYDERDSPPLGPSLRSATVRVLPRVDSVLFSCLVEKGTLLYDSSRFLVEVVQDSGGKRVSDGETGYLCVTRLFSPEPSAIRYVTNLEVTARGNSMRVQK